MRGVARIFTLYFCLYFCFCQFLINIIFFSKILKILFSWKEIKGRNEDEDERLEKIIRRMELN